jgi:hypothetical protein
LAFPLKKAAIWFHSPQKFKKIIWFHVSIEMGVTLLKKRNGCNTVPFFFKKKEFTLVFIKSHKTVANIRVINHGKITQGRRNTT